MVSKVFVINLEKDVKKKEKINSQLQKFNIEFSFFQAINGKELSKAYADDLNSKSIPRLLTNGELGCLLSHIDILKKIGNNDIFLILEDDVVLEEGLTRFLEHIPKINFGWDVILLGHGSEFDVKYATPISLWGRKSVNGFVIGKPVVKAMGAWGYLINYCGAQKILDNFQSYTRPFDHYTGSTDLLNLYVVQKPLLYQSPELFLESNLESERVEVNRRYDLSQTGLKAFIKKFKIFTALNKMRWFLIAQFHYMKVFLPVKKN